MRRTLYALLLLALCCAHARAQPAEGVAAKPVDRFGEILITDWLARLDNFAIELQNHPASRGFIAVHVAKHKFPGWSLRRARFALNYLVESRGLDRARVSVISAGPSGDTAYELWMVGPGAELPFEPFDLSLLMSGEKTALPFDRFTVSERGDPAEPEVYEATYYPDAEELYKEFAEVLRGDAGLRGCVIAYTSHPARRSRARRPSRCPRVVGDAERDRGRTDPHARLSARRRSAKVVKG